ncbi:Piso0_002161 [Millerozyma farinosa CBS 7064]|uniref:Piso0_002161 protein n=1 Tax=Pichia sorbitophila (strain ATCC MYA-4447 / BCRC 22081 / CBS 7064 / NBRC 10061 / NRRL Y-12695) TaxID=559304 RepID=G8YBV4_PICSO|nr:Piso0_002161 [Millerozyma farinosa CBS 7064]
MRWFYFTVLLSVPLLCYLRFQYLNGAHDTDYTTYMVIFDTQKSNSESNSIKEKVNSLVEDYKVFIHDRLQGTVLHEYSTLFAGLSVSFSKQQVSEIFATGDKGQEAETKDFAQKLKDILGSYKKEELKDLGVDLVVESDKPVHIMNEST